ncbi:PREDICTED: uncharacterized protein LOC109349834 [Lupinus angustifolius]|uniref:uncharacterized protein LOC109349834 n=1 Tax=Lupinus angustifolius TaxID=3871 RepID=UPI00092EC2F5|nr:PREDICTED: uncharacterized protein LOC109349834 [Lupinus angustifolius]
MRGIGALLLPKYRLKLSYQEKASAGILATLTPKKQENNEFSEMGLATKEIVDPVVAFSKPPPLPPVLGPLVALSLLETWWKGSADDDGK